LNAPQTDAIRNRLTDLQNEIWKVKVPSDFNRRGRDLTLKYTAEEFRNMCIFLFPLVVEHAPEKYKSVLQLLAFLVRAYLADDFSFRKKMRSGDLRDLLDDFYFTYKEAFDVQGCTYNIHIISHLDLLRKRALLTETSAFQFERSYGGLKFHTRLAKMSKCKRAMQKCLMRSSVGHMCKKETRYTTSPTSRSDDSLIYTEMAPGSHRFYTLERLNVKNTEDPATILHSASKIVVDDYIVRVKMKDKTKRLQMNEVGAYNYKEVGGAAFVKKKDIRGKAIRVGPYIITVPMNVLMET
jgi:hypothetical protein